MNTPLFFSLGPLFFCKDSSAVRTRPFSDQTIQGDRLAVYEMLFPFLKRLESIIFYRALSQLELLVRQDDRNTA